MKPASEPPDTPVTGEQASARNMSSLTSGADRDSMEAWHIDQTPKPRVTRRRHNDSHFDITVVGMYQQLILPIE